MPIKINHFVLPNSPRNNKKRVLRPVKPALNDIITYRQQLYAVLDRAYHDVKTRIYPLLQTIPIKGATDTSKKDIQDHVASIHLTSSVTNGTASAIAIKTVIKVSYTNKVRMQAAFNDAFGVDLPQIINDSGINETLNKKITENINLIKTIPEQYLQRVQKTITAGIINNEQVVDLTKQLSNDYAISQRRAKFIARDQISKINAAISQLRQQNLGIDQYVWVTADDDRVRETHREAEGNTYSYESPPEVTDFNNPGEDYGCRCIAAPIIEFD